MNNAEQVFSLRWSNHENNLCIILESMLKRGILVDVTLSCEGKSLKVHRAILSACSPYFEELFTETDHSHPIIILKDVKPEELQALVDYMYTGQVTVSQSKLNGFLKTAESLKIRGLAYAERQPESVPVNMDSCVPPRKRKRNFSIEDSPVEQRAYESVIQRTRDQPTDLSMPKLDHCSPYIQHIAQTSSSCQYETMSTQGTSKISVKPKEALLPPPPPDVIDVDCEPVNGRECFTSGALDAGNSQHQPDLEDNNPGQESSFSHHVPSDDEEQDNATHPDLEVGAPVVRSGVCSVCGCFRSDLRQHMESHSGQSFQCHLCGRAYPRRKTLNQHIKRSHQLYARSAQGVDTPHNESRPRQQEVNDVP